MADVITAAQRRFLQMHLRTDLAKNGRLPKVAARKTYVFIRGCREAGIIEIIDPDNMFPYTYSATLITKAGRAALATEKK